MVNIKDLIEPCVEKLEENASEEQKIYLGILRSNAKEITATFTKKLTDINLGLTPSEVRVANLVKQGKTSREIADMFGISFRTVEFHRTGIRRKLGLGNKKANLRSYLFHLD